MNLEKELEKLLNKYNAESKSSTPDFILAEYLINCLKNFNQTVRARETWFGREKNNSPQLFDTPRKKTTYIAYKVKICQSWGKEEVKIGDSIYSDDGERDVGYISNIEEGESFKIATIRLREPRPYPLPEYVIEEVIPTDFEYK